MTFKDIVFTVMVIAVFGCLIYLVYYVNTESFKCMSSPLTYGVSKLVYSSDSGLSKSEVSCKCEAPGGVGYYYVTKNNVTAIPYVTQSAAGNNIGPYYFNLSSYLV